MPVPLMRTTGTASVPTTVTRCAAISGARKPRRRSSAPGSAGGGGGVTGDWRAICGMDAGGAWSRRSITPSEAVFRLSVIHRKIAPRMASAAAPATQSGTSPRRGL